MRLALVLALLVTTAAAPLGAAEAADRHRSRHVPADRAFSGPGWRFRPLEGPDFARLRHQRQTIVVPQVVVVSPGRCWQSGYWTYQWVPQSYSYNAWVPGQWSPDGRWIDGHYAQTWYNSGYYQPLWVEEAWSSC
jgi:hypothetical protein